MGVNIKSHRCGHFPKYKLIIIHLLITSLIYIRDVQKTMFENNYNNNTKKPSGIHIHIHIYIYTYTDHEVHKYSMTSVISGSSGTVDLSPKKSNTSSAVNKSLSVDASCILDMHDSDRENLSNP